MDLPMVWQTSHGSDGLSGSQAVILPQQNVLPATGRNRKGVARHWVGTLSQAGMGSSYEAFYPKHTQ